MTSAISGARFAERLANARSAVTGDGADAMLIGIGPDLEWLTGYAAIGHERLNLLLVDPVGPATFIGPRLEAWAARQAPGLAGGAVALSTWDEDKDPYLLVQRALPAARTSRPQMLVSDDLPATFLLGLQRVLPGTSWSVASSVLAPLRRVKDADEIALLRAAAEAADRVIEAVSAGRLVGRSEADVASEVRRRLVDEGHDSAEFSIVASGPNSASPHHQPGERVIRAGEPVLFDIGGRRAGYCSDITRTFWVAADDGTAADDGFVEIHELTRRAQAEARAAIRPGVTFESLDAAARDVISAGGFGEQFFHRLGHGIGLAVHEEPYVIEGNGASMTVGNAFSCEPGIYLEGRYGVRIEDIMICTADGGESLNQTLRGLRVVSGR